MSLHHSGQTLRYDVSKSLTPIYRALWPSGQTSDALVHGLPSSALRVVLVYGAGRGASHLQLLEVAVTWK